MKNSFRSYRIFAGKTYLIVTSVITAVMAFAHFIYGMSLFNPYIGTMFMIPLTALFSCISDYFVYAGISIRRSGIMAYARTSNSGENMIRRGLLVDAVLTGVRSFIIVFFAGLAARIASNGTVGVKDILLLIGMWGNSFAIVGVVNLVCRRIGKTLVTIFLIDYIGVFFVSLTEVIWLIFIFPGQEIANATIYVTIISVVCVAAAVVVNMLCSSDAVKAYRSGFEDEPVRG